MDNFIEIWNEAYNIFTDGDRSEGSRYNDMQRFLMDCVKAGLITLADKCCMVSDIMETSDL